jgi:TP901 family phage tail tape measure protein
MASTAELAVIITAKDLASGVLSKLEGSLGGVQKFAMATGAALLAAGTGVAVGLGKSVSVAADFQQVMSGVAAVSGATSDDLARLSAAAIALGQDTTLSGIGAKDAALAMEALAKGGVSVADQLGGATRGALLLASAGGLDVARASEIAANAMNTFGLAGGDVVRIADLFAAAANSSTIEVDDVAASMAQAGQVAAQLGFSIQDTTAAIAAFGAAGLRGSDAGTSMRTALLNLVNPTDKARAVMDQYGLSFFDANGKMKDFGGIAGELRGKLSGLTDQQRLAALETIFGADAVRAAAILYDEGADGIAKWNAQVGQAGTAAATGAKRNANLRGSLEQLKSSIETAQIALGTALLPLLRQLVDQATLVVNAAIPLIQVLGPRLVAGIQQGARALGAFGTALAALFQSFRTGDFNRAFGPFIAAVEAAFGPTAAGAVTLFVSGVLRGLQLLRDAVLTVQQVFKGQWVSDASIQPVVRFIGETALDIRNRLIPALQDLAGKLLDAGKGFAAVFTPERQAILGQFVRDLAGVRMDVLVAGIRALGTVLPPVVDAFGKFVGFLIDSVGRLQASGKEADILRLALEGIGIWIAGNKILALADQLAGVAGRAKAAADELLRFPKLIISTVRTVFETAGKAAGAAADATQRVTTLISTAFASAKDAAIWAQLYGEQAVQTVTQKIATAWDAVPSPPNIPDLFAKIMPRWEPVPAGPTVAPLKVQVQPEVQATVDLTSVGQGLGASLAKGIAAGVGVGIGTSILGALGPEVLAPVGIAIAALLGVALTAAIPIAIGLGIRALLNSLGEAIQAQGGLGPALAQLLVVAIPTGLGMAAGAIANAGLQLVLLLIQGVTEGIPALVAFISTNFQTIVTTIALILAPLPTLVLTAFLNILSAIGPTLAQIGAAVATAFGNVLVVVGETLGRLGEVAANAVTNVVLVFVDMGAQIIEALANAFAPLAPMIQAIIEGDWGAAVQAGIDFLVGIFVTLPERVSAILSDGFGRIVGIVSAAIGSMAAIVGDGLSAIASVVTTTWATITATIVTAWSNIQAAVGTAVAAVQAVIQAAWDAILGAAAAFFGNFLGGFEQTFNVQLLGQVQAAFSAMVATIGDKIGEMLALVGSLPGQIVGAVGDLGGLLVGAGRAVIGGLIDGISSRLQELRNLAAEIAGIIRDNKGPIEKDRRLLIPAGQAIVGGLMAGIESQFGALARTMRGAPLDTGGGLLARGGTLASAGGGGVSTPVVVHIHAANIYGSDQLEDVVVGAVESAKARGRLGT